MGEGCGRDKETKAKNETKKQTTPTPKLTHPPPNPPKRPSPKSNDPIHSICAYSKGFACGTDGGKVVLYQDTEVLDTSDPEPYRILKELSVIGHANAIVRSIAISPSEETLALTWVLEALSSSPQYFFLLVLVLVLLLLRFETSPPLQTHNSPTASRTTKSTSSTSSTSTWR